MISCLITGGAGFIGSHLTEALLAAGHAVRVLDDFSTGKRENLSHLLGEPGRVSARSSPGADATRLAPFEIIEGSITDAATLKQAMAGITHVFHLAALPSVQLSVENPLASHEVTATGTLRVLEAARHAGVQRVVYAASSSAYGNAEGGSLTETTPLQPLSPYAAAKLAGEHYCQCFTTTYGLETVRLRFFNVFGPRQDAKSPYSGVIALFIAALTQGRTPTIFGDGLQYRDFVYIANVVQALTLAATAPAAVGGVYNIGMGSSITLLDLIRHLNDLLGTKVQPQHAPARLGDVRHSQADITHARRDLGYKPTVSFVDGLQRTLAWALPANE